MRFGHLIGLPIGPTVRLICRHGNFRNMSEDKFIAAFMAMTPDADPEKHRGVIETPLYRLISVLVRDEGEAEKVCADLVKNDGVSSFIFCPGFTSRTLGRLSETLGPNISINVARGDGPSNAVARKAMERAGFFKR